MDLQLTGKVALVVASSKGPGKAIAALFARVDCFLASGADSYMTGSTVTVDGGMARGY